MAVMGCPRQPPVKVPRMHTSRGGARVFAGGGGANASTMSWSGEEVDWRDNN